MQTALMSQKRLYQALNDIGQQGKMLNFEGNISHRTQLIDPLIYMHIFDFPTAAINTEVKNIVKRTSIDLHKTLQLPSTKDLMEFIEGTAASKLNVHQAYVNINVSS